MVKRNLDKLFSVTLTPTDQQVNRKGDHILQDNKTRLMLIRKHVLNDIKMQDRFISSYVISQYQDNSEESISTYMCKPLYDKTSVIKMVQSS